MCKSICGSKSYHLCRSMGTAFEIGSFDVDVFFVIVVFNAEELSCFSSIVVVELHFSLVLAPEVRNIHDIPQQVNRKGCLPSLLQSHLFGIVFRHSYSNEKVSTKIAMKHVQKFDLYLKTSQDTVMNALLSTIATRYDCSCSSVALNLVYLINCCSFMFTKECNIATSSLLLSKTSANHSLLLTSGMLCKNG